MRLASLFAWLWQLLRRLFRRPPSAEPPYLMVSDGEFLAADEFGTPVVWRDVDG
jgi:hypothetical protein